MQDNAVPIVVATNAEPRAAQTDPQIRLQDDACDPVDKPTEQTAPTDVARDLRDPDETQSNDRIESPAQDASPQRDQPQYRAADWRARTEKFLQDKPIAQRFAQEIGRELLDDPRLAAREDCLDRALERVLAKAYVPPEELVRDQAFCNRYVYNDAQIRDEIVKRYLQSLQAQRPPESIGAGGQIVLAPSDRPTSIREAGRFMQVMLANRRNIW